MALPVSVVSEGDVRRAAHGLATSGGAVWPCSLVVGVLQASGGEASISVNQRCRVIATLKGIEGTRQVLPS